MTGAYLAYQEALIMFDRVGTAGLRTAMNGLLKVTHFPQRLAADAQARGWDPWAWSQGTAADQGARRRRRRPEYRSERSEPEDTQRFAPCGRG